MQAAQGAELLLHGQQIRQHLGGVKLVGQAVPDRDAGILGQLVHQLLAEPAVLNAVEHPAQDPGGVSDALLFTHLGAAGVQVCHAHPQIVPCHLESAAGTGGGLFKQQDNVLVLQIAVGNAAAFEPLELLGQVQQVSDFSGGVIEKLQKASASDIDWHGGFLLSLSFIQWRDGRN